MVFLYLEPVLYMPYAISLRKKDAITLDEMRMENGGLINLVGVKPTAKRMPNKNYIYMGFNSPLYMDVNKLVGTDGVVTFVMKYTLRFDTGNVIQVIHRQHVSITSRYKPHNLIKHYSTSSASPAFFGKEGGKVIKGIQEQRDQDRKIISFGLDSVDLTTWAIETFDLLYPTTELKHGALH